MNELALHSHGKFWPSKYAWCYAIGFGFLLGFSTSVLLAQSASTPSAADPSSESLSSPDATAMSLEAPTPEKSKAAWQTNPLLNPSRADIFGGYSYLNPSGSISGHKYNSVHAGAIGSGSYYFNKFLGGEVGGVFHPDGNGDGFTTLNIGPVVRYPTKNLTPFLHFLVGGSRIGGPNVNTLDAHGNLIHTVNPYTWGASLTAGGGLDYALPFWDEHLSLRIFQADYQYMHASFGPEFVTNGLNISNGNILGGRANINAFQLSTGLVFHLGSLLPPPPVTYSCSATPIEVYPGEPVTVSCNALNLNAKQVQASSYRWTATGGRVEGHETTARVDTTGLSPDTYTVTGHVSEGNKAGQSAAANATFTVKSFQPPTVACVADPGTVQPGSTSTITAQGESPQHGPLTYSFSASSGKIAASGPSTGGQGTAGPGARAAHTAILNTTDVAAGVVTITCNVVDEKGQTASAFASVTVLAPPPPPTPKTVPICGFHFDREWLHPAQVDQEGKACLDNVAANLQRNADAKAVVVGSSAVIEMKSAHLAIQRAVNAGDYLVKVKGIDSSRIDMRTGSADIRSVQTYILPAGANFDTDVPGTTEVDMNLVKPHSSSVGTGSGHKKKTTQ